jgi:large repetitive protein
MSTDITKTLKFSIEGANSPAEDISYEQAVVLSEEGRTAIERIIPSGGKTSISIAPDVNILTALKHVSIIATGSEAAKIGTFGVLKVRSYATPLSDDPGIEVSSFANDSVILGDIIGSVIQADLDFSGDLLLDNSDLNLLLAKFYATTSGDYEYRAALPLTIDLHNTSVDSVTVNVVSIFDPEPAAHVAPVYTSVATVDVINAAPGALTNVTVAAILTGAGIDVNNLSISIGEIDTDTDTSSMSIAHTISGADLTQLTTEQQASLITALINYYANALGLNASDLGVSLAAGSIIFTLSIGNIIPVDSTIVDVTSVVLDTAPVVLIEGGSTPLTTTILPEDATNATLFWTSSNSAVAVVSSTGVVTPVGPGTAVITATSLDGSSSDSISITTNFAPVVNAGANQEVAIGGPVTLNGTGTVDPDGDSFSYLWSQTTGPEVAVTGANTANASFIAPDTDQTITFSLTVSDAYYTVSDTVEITVANGAASANAVPDITIESDVASVPAIEGVSLSLTADVTDTDIGQNYDFFWKQIGGTTVSITNATTASGVSKTNTMSFTPNIPPDNVSETLEFLVITSDGIVRAADKIYVEVASLDSINSAPVANAGTSREVRILDEVTLNASASTDPDVAQTLTYSWIQVSGTEVTLVGGETISATFTPNDHLVVDGDILVFEVTVSDPFTSVTAQVTLTAVNEYNIAPTVNADAVTVAVEGTALVLDAGAGDDRDIGDLTFLWSKVSGPAVSLPGDLTTETLSIAFLPSYVSGMAPIVFSVDVTDLDGETSTYTETVYVSTSGAATFPVVNTSATTLTANETGTITLDGSLSANANGGTADITYLWSQVGTEYGVVSITDANLATATVTTLPSISNADQDGGPYELEFMLRTSNTTDPTVYTEQSVTIVVSPETEPPTAIIVQGTDLLVTAGSQSSATAQANSGNVTYSWSELGTSHLNFLTPTNSETVLFDVPVSPATAILRLTVTDTDVNIQSTADIDVTASLISGSAPTAAITVAEGDVIAWNGAFNVSGATSTDGDGTIVGYTLTDINGVFTGTSENAITPFTTGSSDEDYHFQLEVRDNAGNTATTTKRVSVRENLTDNDPVVNVSSSNYQLGGGVINLDGTGTFDPEYATSSLTYAWTVIDAPETTENIATVQGKIASATSLVTTVIPADSGSYTFRLTATDDESSPNSAFDEVVVVVPS